MNLMKRHSSAPTGRHSTAQGEALGERIQNWISPERAKPTIWNLLRSNPALLHDALSALRIR
jgi:hypothetical protein